ncbi:MAG: chromosomal replication initiator protein DnaA [Lentisphaeria bacterium]|jgi:chromosomal replication initiator protein
MAIEIQRVWEEAAARIRERLRPDIFDRWIAGIVPLALEGSVCRLGVSSDMFCEWLTNHYRTLIEETLAAAVGAPCTVHFESGHAPATPPARTAPAHRAAAAKAKETAPPPARPQPGDNPRFTFDTFVVGEANKFTYTACTAVADRPGEAYNPLFIYGGTGLGKTHLLQAIAHHVRRRPGRSRVEYVSSEDFFNRYVEALQEKNLHKFRQLYRNVDLLLIDDVQFLANKDRFQEEFFHTFNSLFNTHKQIVLVSDRAPSEIEGMEKRLVSRFEWGLTTEVQTPDMETRLAIIRKKQAGQLIKLGDDVLELIATRVKSNVRRLEGALIHLVAHTSMNGKPVTRALAEELLQPYFDEDSVAGSIPMERIQKIVAEHFDVRLADMTSKRRPANIAWPRQVAMFLCRRHTAYSTPAIGEVFNRNHATILHAVSTVQARLDRDGDFRQTLGVLERKLKG